MASSCKYFDEDAVYRINKKGVVQFGLVLENSEFVSSDEDDDNDSNFSDSEPLKRGFVRVSWHPRGREEVLPEKKLKLFDRALMPGDVVRKLVIGKDTQLGYCRETKVMADVQVVGVSKVIPDVPSTDLIPLDEFSASIAVYLDSWVGIVKSINTEVTLVTKDGSRCILQDKDMYLLEDVLDRRDDVSEFKKESYYPGQKLWGSKDYFRNATWLNVTNEAISSSINSVFVTVEEVNVTSIKVQWLCRAFYEGPTDLSEVEHPTSRITGSALKRVKMMHIFEPCSLQTGDRNFYVVKAGDHVLQLEEWRKQLTQRMFPERKDCSQQPAKARANFSNGLGESDDSEYEDMDEDDDGNASDTSSVASRSTVSSSSASENRKKKLRGFTLVTNAAKKKKIKRARRKFLGNEPFQVIKPGRRIVTETLITRTNTAVVWQDGTVEKDVSSASLYPIHHLDGHEFFPGDFIVENKDVPKPHEYGVVQKVDHIGRTARIKWMRTFSSSGSQHPEEIEEEDVSVYDVKDHPDFRYRPGSCVIRVANFEGQDPEKTAGQVLDVHPSGMVEVSWVNGQVSKCYPQELYRIFEYDSEDNLWGEDDDSSSDGGSWETESENSVIDGNCEGESTPSEEEKPKGAEGDGEDQLFPEQLLEEGFQKVAELLSSNGFKLDPAAGDAAKREGDLHVKRERIVQTIEKMRTALVRLEEMFSNIRIHNSLLLSQLMQIYKYCRLLDKVLGTSFFHEESVQVLVDQLRQRGGQINSVQHMAEQVTRFFGSSESAAPLQDQSQSDGSSTEPPIAYKSFFQLLKGKLLIAQEYLQQLYGLSRMTVSDAMADSCESSPMHVLAASSVVDEQENTREQGVEEEPLGASTAGQGVFSLLDHVPDSHKYKLSIFQPTDSRSFFKTIRKELNILRTSLPEGIVVKGFEDRMDLFSVLIKGPRRTPYEDGIFLFDFQLPADYPKVPPLCYYISYCNDRLNPNLYEGGKVCVSLLGTWGGKGSEVWNSASSNLLQVIVSIQGLILVSEPYFNEAGYERQRETQQGRENSRMYNEMVVLKLMQAIGKMLLLPQEAFREEIVQHFQQHAAKLVWKLEKWLEISEGWNSGHPASPTTPNSFRQRHFQAIGDEDLLPEFPLLPASRGFCLTLRKTLLSFRDVILGAGIPLHPGS